MINYSQFINKTALITGSSSGIGKDLAIVLSKLGCRIILHGTNEIKLTEVNKLLEGHDNQILQLNFNDELNFNSILKELPNIDFFVNCSGATHSTTLRNLNFEKSKVIFNVNLFSPIDFLTALVKGNKINTDGSVVFITSIAGKTRFSIGNLIYGMSKAAVEGFSAWCAPELAKNKIRVNCIAPGLIETGFSNGTVISEEQYKLHADDYPLGRIGMSDDVIGAILFYLSENSKWVTGTSINVDGGISLI